MQKSIFIFAFCAIAESFPYGFYENLPYSGRSDFFDPPAFYGSPFFGGPSMGPWAFAPAPFGPAPFAGRFGPFPMGTGWNPIRFTGWTGRPYALDGSDVAQIVEIIEAMNLTQSDIDEVIDAAYHWNFTEIYNFVYSQAMQLQPKLRSQALRLIEEYGPPLSLIEALSALTLEQKAHIEELARSNNRRELDRISRGMTSSIPFEDQHQARKFVSMVRYVFGDL
ncbi:hypothetical protein L596_024113 [Steinernema carpocapsae]|uniref:Uncharacterized protein n=1 Tax=Steinernema carpocapsae TaxID=34508 RepID=A0A4U5MFS6_STECR|nr:hypothetical protein L596_024113 [Steinernema carpocapsae]